MHLLQLAVTTITRLVSSVLAKSTLSNLITFTFNSISTFKHAWASGALFTSSFYYFKYFFFIFFYFTCNFSFFFWYRHLFSSVQVESYVETKPFQCIESSFYETISFSLNSKIIFLLYHFFNMPCLSLSHSLYLSIFFFIFICQLPASVSYQFRNNAKKNIYIYVVKSSSSQSTSFGCCCCCGFKAIRV